MPFIPNTDYDRAQQLKRIGVASFEDLLKDIPSSARIQRELKLPPALSESELMREMSQLANENQSLTCFAGGGVYDHFIPSAVWSVVMRPEFLTAYTPYQPEVAQGTLQVIYEFQSHICRLTGMDVANASMYDGASACAEAVLTALSVTKRKKIIFSETLSPMYRQVSETYARGFQAEFSLLPHSDGVSDLSRLADMADDQTACFVVSQPNFFGCLEDIERAVEIMHSVGAMLIVAADPISLALLNAPGDQGADIVVGEGQPLGIPLSFGGPLVGFFSVKKKLIRKLPGRLVARTLDVDGKVGFTLTLQTREQHIKRAKATSNICTNQALCATAVTVYLSLIGKQGLKKVADLCLERAQYAAEKLSELEGFELAFAQPYHREFVLRCPAPASELVGKLCERGILAGVELGRFYEGMDDLLLIAFTEKRCYEEIDQLVAALSAASKNSVHAQHEPQGCA
ncbi:aminomethyl-transferring glycine dehydrogenase subunit GcvPA [Gemmatimonas aurantiaca]|nr:aminomethyl-transferring glycine dehydrogenase subunit GcvPA [Gemmatimonas aurantiaca]